MWSKKTELQYENFTTAEVIECGFKKSLSLPPEDLDFLLASSRKMFRI
jgi:hypothetical protein